MRGISQEAADSAKTLQQHTGVFALTTHQTHTSNPCVLVHANYASICGIVTNLKISMYFPKLKIDLCHSKSKEARIFFFS